MAHWRGMREFPAYRLADAVYNEYAKKRHEWLRVPLNMEVCHDNVRVLRDILRACGIRRWWLSEGSALGLHRDGEPAVVEPAYRQLLEGLHAMKVQLGPELVRG